MLGRAGIEQDASDRQVDMAAGVLGRATGAELPIELRHPVDTAHVKSRRTAHMV